MYAYNIRNKELQHKTDSEGQRQRETTETDRDKQTETDRLTQTGRQADTDRQKLPRKATVT